MARILVVDDDDTVAEVVAQYLVHAGHEVERAADGIEALAAAAERPPDLVVLDVMLPGLDGIEVCRRLRATSDVPIVMLTALGAEVDRVMGLEVGADDYVTKPFSARELVLRIQSVLRRTSSPAPPQPGADAAGLLRDGDLVVDPVARTVTLAGADVGLTLREFDLLVHFLRHPRRAFTREELLREVWGWDFGDLSTVTVHARRLRNKIEQSPASPTRVVTVWGVGYRWEPTAVEVAGHPRD
jgi:DNA-binding response OmpR family regulator